VVLAIPTVPISFFNQCIKFSEIQTVFAWFSTTSPSSPSSSEWLLGNISMLSRPSPFTTTSSILSIIVVMAIFIFIIYYTAQSLSDITVKRIHPAVATMQDRHV